MSYKNILFDLDGTLTDPGEGITNSVMHALKKFDITESDRSRLYKFIGPPLLDSFREYYGFSEEESKLALGYYREYFAKKGMFENTVYDGIEALLKRLKEGGKRLMVATSKPEVYAKEILKHFGLNKYFEFIGGSTLDEKERVHKCDVIKYVLESTGVGDPVDTIMIGDRCFDAEGARKCGIRSIGVLYGYGTKEELISADAVYIAENVEDIESFLK